MSYSCYDAQGVVDMFDGMNRNVFAIEETENGTIVITDAYLLNPVEFADIEPEPVKSAIPVAMDEYKPRECYTTSWRMSDDELADYILEISDYDGFYVVFRKPPNKKYYTLRYAKYKSLEYAKRIARRYNAFVLVVEPDRTWHHIHWTDSVQPVYGKIRENI